MSRLQPKPTRDEMRIAMAADVMCARQLASAAADVVMAAKVAVMMRLGLSNPVAMMVAIEGSERLGAEAWKQLVLKAGLIMNQPAVDTLLVGTRKLLELEARSQT